MRKKGLGDGSGVNCSSRSCPCLWNRARRVPSGRGVGPVAAIVQQGERVSFVGDQSLRIDAAYVVLLGIV